MPTQFPLHPARQLRPELVRPEAPSPPDREQFEEMGHELRRPAADFLRDGVYELRARRGHVQYRILCFFHRRNVAILAHSITKEESIPPAEIDRALERNEVLKRNRRTMRMRKTKSEAAGRASDAGVILDRMMGNDPAMRQLVADARSNAGVARVIFDARTKAKLTQKELANWWGQPNPSSRG